MEINFNKIISFSILKKKNFEKKKYKYETLLKMRIEVL